MTYIVEGPFSLSINLAPTILTCISQVIFEVKHLYYLHNFNLTLRIKLLSCILSGLLRECNENLIVLFLNQNMLWVLKRTISMITFANSLDPDQAKLFDSDGIRKQFFF